MGEGLARVHCESRDFRVCRTSDGKQGPASKLFEEARGG
jgi:hypothetical protein